METLYPSYNTPVYRSIPDLIHTDPEQLSFREKHRVRIFDQFEPITDADLYPVEQLPHVDRSCQTTPLPVIEQPPPPPPAPPAVEKKRKATWTWPSTKPNDTFRVIKGLRDAQAENTYGFAYYNELSHTELELNTPSTSGKQPRSRHNPRTAGTRLVPLESSGAQMEVTYARTNWEALMQHINDSIRDTNQQRMIGQYMIQKLKKEQTRANLPPDQIELNKRCLEKLIQKYGTGLESIVAKEKEFERLIEAYQVFMRGDKKRQSKKRADPRRQRKVKEGEEPLPAIGDLKAGRSQVGCKIRQDLRKEYGERLRKDKTKGPAKPAKVQLVQQPGAAPRPMQVRVRRSVLSSNIKYEESDEELPPTPKSEEADELVTESQLSVTYVPTEATLLGPEEHEGLVVITQEDEQEDLREEEEEEVKEEVKEESGDECLMLEGDSGSDVLLVDSSTELVHTEGSRTPNFTIEDPVSLTEETKEEAAAEEETVEEATATADPVVIAAEEPVEKVAEAGDAVDIVEEEAGVDEAVKEVEEGAEEEASTAVEEASTAVEEASTAVEDAVEDAAVEDAAETSLVSLEAVSSEEELKGLREDDVTTEEEVMEGYQLAAVNLISDVLERLDSEVGSEPVAEQEGEVQEGEVKKSVTFKSSPDISYYERASPVEPLPEHSDVTKDLSTAETELDDEARALYHKVLSNIDPADLAPSTVAAEEGVTEDVVSATVEATVEATGEANGEATIEATGEATIETDDVAGEELKENSPIAMVAKELTDEILRKIDTPPVPETVPETSEAGPEAEVEYTTVAAELTNDILTKVSSQPSTPAPVSSQPSTPAP